MEKYLAVISASYKITIEHRANMLVANFQSIFALFILFYFWRSVYEGKDVINGYTFAQIVTYYFLIRVTYNRISTFGADVLAKAIKSGEITRELVKPINYIYYSIARNFVAAFIWAIGNLAAILLFSYFLYSVLVIPSIINFLFFSVVFVLNGILSILINAIIGSVGFWITEVTHLKTITSQLIALFSGGLIPIAFFPQWTQGILNILPFRFLIQFPADVFLGKLSVPEVIVNILILIMWLVVCYCLASVVFKKGLKGYESYN